MRRARSRTRSDRPPSFRFRESADPEAPGTMTPSVNGRAEVSTRQLVVAGLGVHTWLIGEGEPVVLVHGFGVSGRYMVPLARSLARAIR
jgi:hypothetical protein